MKNGTVQFMFGLVVVAMAALSMTGCTNNRSLGGDRDNHGCIASAGYSWCEAKQKCIRPFEENCTSQMVGNDVDEHGCIASAGYSWCEPNQKCLRVWEESCGNMTLTQAVDRAENSECTAMGNLTNTSSYNPNSKTWWINLEMKPQFAKKECNPACVLYENGTVEINWRCTGLSQ